MISKCAVLLSCRGSTPSVPYWSSADATTHFPSDLAPLLFYKKPQVLTTPQCGRLKEEEERRQGAGRCNHRQTFRILRRFQHPQQADALQPARARYCVSWLIIARHSSVNRFPSVLGMYLAIIVPRFLALYLPPDTHHRGCPFPFKPFNATIGASCVHPLGTIPPRISMPQRSSVHLHTFTSIFTQRFGCNCLVPVSTRFVHPRCASGSRGVSGTSATHQATPESLGLYTCDTTRT